MDALIVTNSIPKTMWCAFKRFERHYGTAQAIGIMAVVVSKFAVPCRDIAETWHQIRTSNSLLKSKVQGLAHLLHLDVGDRETLTSQRVQELGHEVHEELQAVITQRA